ncbi:hypothetical protein RHSIM_Rhsim07G0186800 [Rhododendron simsii]|uniref:UBX domain-containing protein n=1 Tax=Rhododendron simsii TaxID=118357 RepID=A0A834GP96_RHOSS|nr:hypothetical protein RHSIM_Rhsim07G0186800 [Rhododendron simsii]
MNSRPQNATALTLDRWLQNACWQWNSLPKCPITTDLVSHIRAIGKKQISKGTSISLAITSPLLESLSWPWRTLREMIAHPSYVSLDPIQYGKIPSLFSRIGSVPSEDISKGVSGEVGDGANTSHGFLVLTALPMLLQGLVLLWSIYQFRGVRYVEFIMRSLRCLLRNQDFRLVYFLLSDIYGLAMGKSDGSGTIIDSDGTNLTCAHAVVDFKGLRSPSEGKVDVTLQDGRTFEGTVLNADLHSDIAIVKINSKTPLPMAQLGSSSKLRPGDWVVAMGCPLSLQNTVTAGIVSCVDRNSSDLGLGGMRREYLQTDCAINGKHVHCFKDALPLFHRERSEATALVKDRPVEERKRILEAMNVPLRHVKPNHEVGQLIEGERLGSWEIKGKDEDDLYLTPWGTVPFEATNLYSIREKLTDAAKNLDIWTGLAGMRQGFDRMENWGDLNAAINAHFTGDRNIGPDFTSSSPIVHTREKLGRFPLSNDIEEEMIRAAVEASISDGGKGYLDLQIQSLLDDAELEEVFSWSLKEPTSDDKNQITIQVRMPDGSHNDRQFLKSDKLQSIFDFIDVGGWFKPCSHILGEFEFLDMPLSYVHESILDVVMKERTEQCLPSPTVLLLLKFQVRPYTQRAFSDGETALALNELGFTSKEEVIFLELI